MPDTMLSTLFERLAIGVHGSSSLACDDLQRQRLVPQSSSLLDVIERSGRAQCPGYNTLGMKHLKALFAPMVTCIRLHCIFVVHGCLQDNNTEVSCKFFEKAEALTDPANLPLPKLQVRGSPLFHSLMSQAYEC